MLNRPGLLIRSNCDHSSGGSKEVGASLARSKFFHFHAVFGKNLENNRELAPPGKFLIHHCIVLINILDSKLKV